MKSKCLLFTFILSFCLVLISGCGETTYKITTSVNEEEYGYVVGAGNYVMGSTVNLKMYPNDGCSVESVTFGDSETPTSFENGEEYTLTSFAVSQSSIGNYMINFSCEKKDITGDEYKNKYKVRYMIVVDGATLNNPFNLTLDSNGTGYEEIVAGKLITRNISYVTKIGGFDFNNKVIKWYTNPNCTKEFNYLKDTINSDITLYGKAVDIQPIDELNIAISKFKELENMVITSKPKDNQLKTTEAVLYNVDGLQIGVKVKDAASNNNPYLHVYKDNGNKSNSNNQEIDYKGTYYTYNEDSKKYGKINLYVSKYSLKDIDNIYRYIKVKDISISSPSDITVSDKCTYTNANSIVKCYAFGEYVFALDKGIIKEFSDKNYSYLVEYKEGVNSIAVASAIDTYLVDFKDITYDESVKNEANGDKIKEKIQGHFTFDNLLKVTSFNENLKNMLDTNEFLKTSLKKYVYEWRAVINNKCSTQKVNFEPAISSHTSMCLHITSSIAELKNAIKDTTFKQMVAELNNSWGIGEKTYNNEEALNFLDFYNLISETATGEMEHLYNDIDNLVNNDDFDFEFGKSEVSGNNSIFEIYKVSVVNGKKEKELMPSLKFTLDENKKLIKIDYFYGLSTYTYTFSN